MVKIPTPFRELICPICDATIEQVHPISDENGEMALHIRISHPNANLYNVCKKLYEKMKLKEPDNLKDNSTPLHIQNLCQYLAITLVF